MPASASLRPFEGLPPVFAAPSARATVAAWPHPPQHEVRVPSARIRPVDPVREFPASWKGDRVEQLDDTHCVAGQDRGKRGVDAEIFEQRPDMRIAWRSTSARRNDGW